LLDVNAGDQAAMRIDEPITIFQGNSSVMR